MAPQQKLAGDELFNRVVDALRGAPGSNLDEFTFHGLNRDIDALLKRCPEDKGALCAKAALYSTRSVEEASKIFDRTVTLYPADVFVRQTYATFLNQFGELTEALSHAHQAWRMSEGSLRTLDLLIRLNLKAGNIEEAQRWHTQWDRERPDQPHELASELEGTATVANTSPDADLLTIGEMGALAVDLARKHGVKARMGYPRLKRDDETVWLHLPIQLNANEDIASDLNLELIDAFAETDLLPRIKGAATVFFTAGELGARNAV